MGDSVTDKNLQEALKNQQKTIDSLRAMLDGQKWVSEQHHKQVQRLAAEKADLARSVLDLVTVWEEEGYDGDRFDDLFSALAIRANGMVPLAPAPTAGHEEDGL